jgi:hypothetical protein
MKDLRLKNKLGKFNKKLQERKQAERDKQYNEAIKFFTSVLSAMSQDELNKYETIKKLGNLPLQGKERLDKLKDYVKAFIDDLVEQYSDEDQTAFNNMDEKDKVITIYENELSDLFDVSESNHDKALKWYDSVRWKGNFGTGGGDKEQQTIKWWYRNKVLPKYSESYIIQAINSSKLTREEKDKLLYYWTYKLEKEDYKASQRRNRALKYLAGALVLGGLAAGAYMYGGGGLPAGAPTSNITTTTIEPVSGVAPPTSTPFGPSNMSYESIIYQPELARGLGEPVSTEYISGLGGYLPAPSSTIGVNLLESAGLPLLPAPSGSGKEVDFPKLLGLPAPPNPMSRLYEQPLLPAPSGSGPKLLGLPAPPNPMSRPYEQPLLPAPLSGNIKS